MGVFFLRKETECKGADLSLLVHLHCHFHGFEAGAEEVAVEAISDAQVASAPQFENPSEAVRLCGVGECGLMRF